MTFAEVQSNPLDRRLLVAGWLSLIGVLAATWAIYSPAGEMLTRNTVRLSLAWYAAALIGMMRLKPADWTAGTARGRIVRWCWTWSIACFLVHLAMAFHFYHHWSHADAFERTRQISGVGEGIYTSYLFTMLWMTDALWWWTNPAAYARRSVWIDRTLHGFMLFIVFNGMVVYEQGPIRGAGIAMFLGLGGCWIWNHRREQAILR